MEHRFSLDRSPKKFTCPQCHRHRRFVRYIDNQTGDYLPDYVGRCDREDNCQYHFTPKMYFAQNPSVRITQEDRTAQAPPPPKDLSFIPPEDLRKTLRAYDRNNFVKWLHSQFDAGLVDEVCELYHVGTSKRWAGATVFWQVDTDLKVRQAKIMLYNAITGRRVKEHEEPNPGQAKVYFAGKAILRGNGISDPNPQQCFFGEHLLSSDAGRIVAIVESEKTAILMTLFSRMNWPMTDFIWLATGGKNGCRWTSPEVFDVLAGRKVVLFPDLKALEDWQFNSFHLTGCSVTVSNLIERNATPEDREQGLDIADFYLRIWQREKTRPALPVTPAPAPISSDPPEARHPAPRPTSAPITQAPTAPGIEQATPPAPNIETFTRDGHSWQVEINKHGYPATWDEEPEGSAPPPAPVTLPKILTRQERTLAAMLEKNPLVGELIERFDLEPLG